MDPNSHFCTKCGNQVTPSAVAPAANPAQSYTPPPQIYAPQAQPNSGGGAMKIVLIVLGVLVVIGLLGIIGVIGVVHHARRRFINHSYITENGRNSSVETPFGRASTSQSDAKSVARQIGVDVYPGAKGGESSTSQFGKMTTASVKLTTPDSVDRVAAFYKSHYPHAMVSQEAENKFTLVNSDDQGTLTIEAENDGDATRIEISKVGGLKINVH
jgi:hypothetical protein